jgi:hypothetical protein
MRTLFLDTETTGLSGERDRIVEIAIIGDDGSVLVDTLVNPRVPIPPEATAIRLGLYTARRPTPNRPTSTCTHVAAGFA